ncbi:MAG: dehydratase [Deltaproteobacteria bacterium]|nr:dehydratase [Deltaproteobacteria bacterium]
MGIDWGEWVVGQEREFVKPPVDKVQLVKYAGAAADFNLIHTDDETARRAGFPGVIVQGMLVMGSLGQYLGELVQGRGFVSRLQARFLGVVLPGVPIACRLKVTGTDREKGTVDFDLAAETEPGRPSLAGGATITLFPGTPGDPRRGFSASHKGERS